MESHARADTLETLLAAAPIPSGGYRPIDGQGNNTAHPTWANPNARLRRGASGSHYADGLSVPAGTTRPSARAVSNAVVAQSSLLPNATGLSDYIWTWGQFLDHDFSLTEGAAEGFPVVVPTGDPSFDPTSTGNKTIPFRRALFDATTGSTTPREQLNEITGFIDGSNVYGSTPERAQWLRTHSGGQLKVTHAAVGDLLPYNDGTIPNAGSPEQANTSTTLFVAGDIRANEQPTLAVLHTLFVREHNRLAHNIATLNPLLSDEELYQRARRIVISEIQKVTYEEFVPALLGTGALPGYGGYNAGVNPEIAAAFSGAAYRLGHTLLSPQIQRLNEDGSSIAAGPLSLRDSFFAATPPFLASVGIEPFLRGVAAQRAQELDIKVIDDVRNFLFGPPGAGGLDLISLNIQRGRDLGLPDFNTLRADYGLPPKSAFTAVTSDPALAAGLASVYATVNDLDPFVGLLIEDDAPGSIVGETLRAVLVDQFVRSRDGDRFFYQRDLAAPILSLIQSTKLSDIIKRNTSISNLQPYVFYVRGVHGNP